MLKLGDPAAVEAERSHKAILTSSKVRTVITCEECLKPRCVYSARKLGQSEKQLLEVRTQEKTFTCGCALFPPSSALVDTVLSKQNIGCIDPIETQYYSATLVSFPPLCYYCGACEESLVEDDLMHQLRTEYAVVRPICSLCKSSGKQPFTRIPNNAKIRPKRN